MTNLDNLNRSVVQQGEENGGKRRKEENGKKRKIEREMECWSLPELKESDREKGGGPNGLVSHWGHELGEQNIKKVRAKELEQEILDFFVVHSGMEKKSQET